MARKGLLEKMEPAEIELNLKNLDDNLRSIYNDSEVPDLIQARLALHAFTSIPKFQSFAFSSDAVKETCKALGMEEVSLTILSMISAMTLAWQTCKTRTESTAKYEAEKKNLGIEPTLRPGEYTTYKQQYEIAHGVKTAEELPGASILEKLDKEFEDGEFKPIKL